MENTLNVFHYCIYLMELRLHYFFNKINPALLLGRLPSVKRKFEKKGQNFYDEVNKVATDKKTGFGIITVGIILITIIGVILIITFTIISNVLGLYEYVPRFYFFLFAAISAYICNIYVLKKINIWIILKNMKSGQRSKKLNYNLLFSSNYRNYSIFFFKFNVLLE